MSDDNNHVWRPFVLTPRGSMVMIGFALRHFGDNRDESTILVESRDGTLRGVACTARAMTIKGFAQAVLRETDIDLVVRRVDWT